MTESTHSLADFDGGIAPPADADGGFQIETTTGPTGYRKQKVRHTAGAQQAGFDHTQFSSPARFEAFLDSVDLPTKPVAVSTRPDSEHSAEMTNAVWYNDRVALISGCDPLCDDPDSPLYQDGDGVWLHYVGIEGHPPAVDEVFRAVKEYRTMTDGHAERGCRGFI
jgi:hypothetical protein